MHTNAEIAEFLDPDKTRAGWWKHEVDIECRTIWEPRLPDFATDDIACFSEIRPVLLALAWHITNSERATSVQDDVGVTLVFEDTYAAAVTAAFSWAMDNQPEALRRACDSINNGEIK